MPKANRAFWAAKLARNRQRDRETDRLLRAAGWTVFRVWEHEPAERAARRIAEWVAAKRRADSTVHRRRGLANRTSSS